MYNKIIYTDASYDWNKTDKNGCGIGKICLVIGKKVILKEFMLCFAGLKQLSNRFELEAIKHALELGGDNCKIYSDSNVAVSWIKDKRVNWISREKNKAGKVFENEKNH